MLVKMGGILYRRRIVALLVALTIVVCATSFGLGVFKSLNNTEIAVDNSDSSQANQLLRTEFPNSGTDVVILLSSERFSAVDATFRQAATALLSELNKRTEVASITSYYFTPNPDFISLDGHETLALLRLKGEDSTTKQDEYTRLKPLLTSQVLQVRIGGPIPVQVAVTEQASDDLKIAELWTLPVLAVLLLLIFSGVIAASLPLLIGTVAILGTLAVLRGLTTVTDISIYAINVVTLLGFGLAIDYSLFMVSRFREELNYNGQNVRAALERTMTTAGRTVIFSALTVSTSLLSLLLFPLNFLRSLGLGAISAVLMVMLVSLTILPVLLALLGPRVNALSLRRLIQFRRSLRADNAGEQQGMWYRLSVVIIRRPVPVTLAVVLVLVVLGLPFFHIKLGVIGIKDLPASQEVRVVSQRLGEDFARRGNAELTIVITTPGNALSPENLASLDSYVKSVRAIPGVVAVQSLVTVNPNLDLAAYQQLYAHPDLNPQITQVATSLANNNFTKMTVAIQPTDHSSEATTLVEKIRALNAPGSLTAQVTGETPIEIDLVAGIEGALPQAFLVIIGSVFLLLFLMTGSLIVPLKAIILNVLSLSASFGSLAWVFQDGHLREILHFEPPGSIAATVIVLTFSIAFGLSMDYEIFLLSRIKERFDETGNNSLAISSGLQSTGWLITCAALLLGVVLGGYGLSSTITLKELGVGLVTAVIVDATLIRMLLLPAAMRLMGTFNWWAPAPLRWLWQYIGFSETGSRPTLSPVSDVQAGREKPLPIREALASDIREGREKPLPLGEALASDIREGREKPLPLGDNSGRRTSQLSKPVQSAIEAQRQAKVLGEEVHLAGIPNVISALTADGEEVMGPEILLWRSPNRVVNGSLLTVESNHFCVVKTLGALLNVYGAGQHIVQAPENPLSGSVQLTFDGVPILQEYEAIYISRVYILVENSGIAITQEMAEVDYRVGYHISVATREDAIRLVEHMPPYRGHRELHVQDISAYAKPVIEQAVNQLIQSIPLRQVRELQMQDLSLVVHKHLQQFLSLYGITLGTMSVLISPRDERMKAMIALQAFGLSEIDAMQYYADITRNSKEYDVEEETESIEKRLYIAWQSRLEHYKNEMVAIWTELESTRTDLGLRMDAHNARLQELSRAMSTDLRASVPTLDSTALPELQIVDRTGQFSAIDRSIPTVTGSAGTRLAPVPESGFSTSASETRGV